MKQQRYMALLWDGFSHTGKYSVLIPELCKELSFIRKITVVFCRNMLRDGGSRNNMDEPEPLVEGSS